MPRIFHVVEQHATSDPRILRARQSWSRFYTRGEMIPVHVKDPELNARHLGDKRDLPLLRLVLDRARRQAAPGDLVVLTNSDNLLHPELTTLLHGLSIPAACSFRLNTDGPVNLAHKPALLVRRFHPDYGRDLFVFTGAWLEKHWNSIPDMFVGEWEWDLIMALLVRRSLGVETRTTQDFHKLTEADLPLGYVLHEKHASPWKDRVFLDSPAKEWNKAQAHAWYEDHGLMNLFTLGL